MSTLVLTLLGLVAVWWWLARMRVSRKPVGMVATRIHFPDGGIALHDPAKAVSNLRNPEEIVIPFDHAILVIEYPLSNPATIGIQASLSQGFTRAELVRTVCEEYANVYEAEEATADTKTIPKEERTILRNRNRTDGVYGIWGHDLEDLVLTAIRWTRAPDGSVRIELHVQS
ncbi:MAG TPA: hypothetical protein VM513_01070 [Kofleriaceae bacterium]|nr:hypothetical protein [Kofleriaceae bacterium]